MRLNWVYNIKSMDKYVETMYPGASAVANSEIRFKCDEITIMYTGTSLINCSPPGTYIS